MLPLNPNQLLLKPKLLSESVFFAEILYRLPSIKIDSKNKLSKEDKVLLTYSRKKLVSVLNYLSLNKVVKTRDELFKKLHVFLNVEICDYEDLDDTSLEDSNSSDLVDVIVDSSRKEFLEAKAKLQILKNKIGLLDSEFEIPQIIYFFYINTAEEFLEAIAKLQILKNKIGLLDSEFKIPLIIYFFHTNTAEELNCYVQLVPQLRIICESFTNLQIVELLIYFKENSGNTKLFVKKALEYRASVLLDSFGDYNHDFKNMLFCFLFDSNLKIDLKSKRIAVNTMLILFNEKFPVSVRMISFLVLSSLFKGFASICSKEFLNVLDEFMRNANDSLDFNIDAILDDECVNEFVHIFNLLENFYLFYKDYFLGIDLSNYLSPDKLNTALLKSFIVYNNYSLDFLSSQLESSSRDEILESMLKIYSFGPRFKSLAEDYILNFDSDFQFSFWSRVSNVDFLMKLNSDYGYLNDDNSKKLFSVYENASIDELDLLNSSNLLSFKYKKILLKKRIELRIDKMKYKLFEAINFTKKVVFVSVLSSFALSIMFALLQNYFDTNVLSEFFADFNVSHLFDSSSSDVQNSNFLEPTLPNEPSDFVEPTEFVEPADNQKVGDFTNNVPLVLDENEVLPESVQIQTENPGSRVHMRDADGEILKNRFGFNRYWKDGARLVVDANSSYEKEINGEYHMFYEIIKSGQRTGRFISSSTWR